MGEVTAGDVTAIDVIQKKETAVISPTRPHSVSHTTEEGSSELPKRLVYSKTLAGELR